MFTDMETGQPVPVSVYNTIEYNTSRTCFHKTWLKQKTYVRLTCNVSLSFVGMNECHEKMENNVKTVD